jgi:hypothetical protein
VREYWDQGDFPWLTSAKVYDRNVVNADQFVTATALRECHLPVVEPGAVLIAITGQGKTLGHCAVLRMRATVSQHVAYVAIDDKRADPSFIRGYLETKVRLSSASRSRRRRSTKGALTCAFLRGVPIPLPTLEEQREIVVILDAIDRKIDLHQRKRAVLSDLFTAVLHKLITGEIRVSDLDLFDCVGNAGNRDGRVSDLRISEAGTVQFPMVAHATEIGWTPITPDVAKLKRGGEAGMLMRDEVEIAIAKFNPWLTADGIRQLLEKLEAVPATIDGNREMLAWLRGERKWYDENERRLPRRPAHRLRSARRELPASHVEWKLKPRARKGTAPTWCFSSTASRSASSSTRTPRAATPSSVPSFSSDATRSRRPS